MENQKVGWATVAFADYVKHGHDAEHLIAVIVSTWEAVDQAMRPVIGRGGVDALFHRSVDVTAASYPWMSAVLPDAQPVLALETLRNVLSKQEPAHFAAASDALLRQFHHLLANLIGLSLTKRLLRSVLDSLLESLAKKDI
ncbi:MAG: hypothetical protein V4695_05625 [Pseudomonadota bacterium]